MKPKLLFIGICCIMLASCSHQMRLAEAVNTDKMKIKISNNDADRRNAYIIYDVDKSKAVTLSEPPPDVIVSQTTDLVNKLKVDGKIDTEQNAKLAESVIQLGQRTVEVNILRDALFRLNEMNVNHDNQLMDSISSSLFRRILKVAQTIAVADQTKAEAEKAKAQTDLIKVTNIVELEDAAYDYILNKDYNNALSSFAEVEKTYPSYHSAYDIVQLLKKYDSKKITDADWQEIYKQIKDKYLWHTSKETTNKFKK